MADAESEPTPDSGKSKPSVLIVGGLGFIGRYLAKYIYEHNLASEVRLVDKVLPQLAHLAPEFSASCTGSVFVQADASRPASMPRIFDRANTTAPWDYVFNLGGETALSQPAEIYRLRSYTLSTVLAAEAAKRGCGVFVEASTGLVYASARNEPRREGDKVKPWLKIARSKLETEEALSRTPGLNLVILRLAFVYGEYDRGAVSKMLCLARVYKQQERELKWLWSDNLRVNTVWVQDVVRALWRAAEWRSQNQGDSVPEGIKISSRKHSLMGGSSSSTQVESSAKGGTPVFNIVDHGNSDQGTFAKLAAQVFGIKTGFHGTLISQFAKMNLDKVTDDLNEELLQGWADMLAEKGISQSGPLSPFLEKDLLKDGDMYLDGSLFEKVCGFQYERGSLDEQGLREILASYERMGWWP